MTDHEFIGLMLFMLLQFLCQAFLSVQMFGHVMRELRKLDRSG